MAAVHPEPWLRALITKNNNMELNQMSAVDRFPVPQFIFWLPLVAIPSSNVLCKKALYRDS
jgi:hypothetical protein